MRRLLIAALCAIVAVSSCGTDPSEEPLSVPAATTTSTVSETGGDVGANGDRFREAMDAWAEDMIASMPARTEGGDSAAFVSELLQWETDLIAATAGGEPAQHDLDVDVCVADALAAAVAPERLDEIAAGLEGTVFMGVPVELLIGHELNQFDETALGCGPVLAVAAAAVLADTTPIPTGERCLDALAADPEFVVIAARGELLDAAEAQITAAGLATRICTETAVADADAPRPRYEPDDDPAAYIAAMMEWTSVLDSAFMGSPPTDTRHQVDHCLADAITLAAADRLAAVAAVIDEANVSDGFPAEALTGSEMAAFEEAVTGCGSLLASEFVIAVGNQVTPPAELLPAATADSLDVARGSCEASLAADSRFARRVGRAVTFTGDAAREETVALWAALCEPYLVLATTEALVLDDTPRPIAECMAQQIVSAAASGDPAAGAAAALLLCGADTPKA